MAHIGAPRDHPRVCGENRTAILYFHNLKGSPPRVRGKPLINLLICYSSRITPACAGKTHLHAWISCSAGDHPRVCGENCGAVTVSRRILGSPPRVRGKRLGVGCLALIDRITPACAGKTLSSPSLMRGAKDHPRVCGENRLSLRGKHTKAGSPPRVRGKHHVIDFAKEIIGITPACAGKTSARTMLRTSCRDHPRVCGENGCPSRPFAQQ